MADYPGNPDDAFEAEQVVSLNQRQATI